MPQSAVCRPETPRPQFEVPKQSAAGHGVPRLVELKVSVRESLIFYVGFAAMAKGSSPFNGGRGRDRTGGLVVANDALSQLSYTPTSSSKEFSRRTNSFQRCTAVFSFCRVQ
jgi:hypothetical protein